MKRWVPFLQGIELATQRAQWSEQRGHPGRRAVFDDRDDRCDFDGRDDRDDRGSRSSNWPASNRPARSREHVRRYFSKRRQRHDDMIPGGCDMVLEIATEVPHSDRAPAPTTQYPRWHEPSPGR